MFWKPRKGQNKSGYFFLKHPVGCQGWGGHNGEKNFVALFHVSEHSEHFKSILKN